MRELLIRLFPLPSSTDVFSRRRAMSTYAGALLILAIDLFLWCGSILSVIGPLSAAILLFSVVAAVVAVLIIALMRRGQQLQAAVLFLGIWLAFCAYTLVSNTFEASFVWAVLLMGISLGAMLIGARAVLFSSGLAVVLILLSAWLNPDEFGGTSGLIVLRDIVIMVGYAAVNYVLALDVISIAQKAEVSNVQRSRLTDASILITQRLLATRLNLNELLNETVKLMSELFPDIDDVQIYLVDQDHRNASLAASTRSSDEMPIGQQVGIGSLSVIGRVTISGQPIVVRDTSEDRPYRRTAFLQGTHAELAIPLQVGKETIGAIDLQSQKSGAFPPDEAEVLETLANQIAVAVDNARLYSESQAQLVENKRLFEQARANLREIERLNQQLTGGAWGEYLRSQATPPAYTIDLMSGQVEDAAEWTPTLAETARRNQLNIRQTETGKVVALPISVRGQAIGAMEFEVDTEQDITPEQMNILQQVVERLGLAAENARLFEEAQRIAQREALVNEISARMQVTTNVEAVVAAATQSLADAFQSPRVAIRLGTPADSAEKR